MSFVALIVRSPDLNVDLLKKIHALSKRSLIDLKKAAKNANPLVVVNMLKSTEREEMEVFLSVLDLCKRENISYQLIRKNEPIDNSSEISSGDVISPEAFAKLLERARLIELQTQELVDREVGDD